MKRVALMSALMVLVIPNVLVPAASPLRAAAHASVPVADIDLDRLGQIFIQEYAVTIPAGVLNGQGA
ncbi:MAG TPA: hypothetical protein VE981_17540 [Planctomycetota bacterium]|nr:hypothetical protein [Planctomycetota bacterium]